MSTIYCLDCHAAEPAERAGWMCRTCGAVLPAARSDAKATGLASHVARHLGCDDLDDVPDVLKRVLADNADAEVHRRVLEQQRDAALARADAADAECAGLRERLREAESDRAEARIDRHVAIAERDALRAVVGATRVYLAAADIVDANLPTTLPQYQAMDAARAALDAALSSWPAPGGAAGEVE